MSVYHWLLLASIAFCFFVCLCWFLKIIKPVKDFSDAKGSVSDGVIYSNTVAMLPHHKESAFLHLPTYIGGIIFHIGIFVSILFIILQLIFPEFWYSAALGENYSLDIGILEYRHKFHQWDYIDWLRLIFGIGLIISALCGLAILIKRFVNKELKQLSNLDDFISNILVTIFLSASAFAMLMPYNALSKPLVFVVATVLFFYMPFGKLRHFLYYFGARYQLGVFYGKRGVWSMKNKKSN